MKVVVLMGGISSEREISLISGHAAAQALEKIGHEVVRVDFRGDNLDEVLKNKPDVVFIALHGKYGEDGTVQGFLDLVRIPYTGSGVLSSAICMDKIMTKKILLQENIPTPRFKVVNISEIEKDCKRMYSDLISSLGLPLVLKPPREGSAIGVKKVKDVDEFLHAAKEIKQLDNEILVEENIEGKELTVGILGNKNLQALPTIEIVSKTSSGFYDFFAKYKEGGSLHIIPAQISPQENSLVQDTSLKVHKVLRCRGISRVDLILKDGIPYVLETNTIPGLTGTSLVPEAAKYVGISFEDLVDKLIKLAIEKE